MALSRSLAIGLIRLAGSTQIKRTIEHLAADHTRILLLGPIPAMILTLLTLWVVIFLRTA
ncbi:hypothetical protein [Actinoplanes sp. NPDC026623]|uniref:hypothetical protein n=1 Tax=Actinoplanes sp. NPDC026623 TaxID=3155610 RepID=UPI0034039BF6